MLYYLPNARSEAQRDEMVALEAAGICIFCPQHHCPRGVHEVLLEHEKGTSLKKQILLANDTWVVLRNEYPYLGTEHHVMMVPKEHVTRKTHLSGASRDGYWDILERVDAEYGRSHFVEGSRNGDPRYTGATITHLHVQIIVGDPSNKGEPVKFYASSVPTDNPPPI